MKPTKSMCTIKAAMAVVLAVFMAGAIHPDAGTAAFPFLNMGYDARSVAMGGASCAVPNDVYGVLSNPAALGYAARTQIMGGYRQVIMDVWGGPLGISMPTSLMGGSVIAPHVISLTTGDFDIIDENGLSTGRRAASSYTALGVSAAKTFLNNSVSVGATLKGAYHYIGTGDEQYSADGFALDCGVQYRQSGNRLIYGASLRNAGFLRSGYLNEWNEHGLPYGVEAGVSYIPRHIADLRVAFDVNKYSGDYANFEPALEYAIIKNTLFLRGGYAFSSMDAEKMFEVFKGERDDTYRKSGISTLSLGVGVAAAMDNVDIKLDAAMQFYSSVSGPSVIVSLIVVF